MRPGVQPGPSRGLLSTGELLHAGTHKRGSHLCRLRHGHTLARARHDVGMLAGPERERDHAHVVLVPLKRGGRHEEAEAVLDHGVPDVLGHLPRPLAAHVELLAQGGLRRGGRARRRRSSPRSPPRLSTPRTPPSSPWAPPITADSRTRAGVHPSICDPLTSGGRPTACAGSAPQGLPGARQVRRARARLPTRRPRAPRPTGRRPGIVS